MKKQLLILITFFTTGIGFSQTFTDNFITYNVISTSPNEVEITDYDTNGGTVVTIPEMVTNNSITYSVKSIGTAALQQKNLTNVFISSSVENIENQAFSTNNLTNVAIPNGVTNIGGSAFRNNDLTNITIPSSVIDIEFAAFRDNPLVSITSQATNPATVITGGINDSFYIRSAIDLTIPSGTSAAYASGGWTGFNSVTEATPLAVGDTFVVDFITYEVTSTTPDIVEAIDYNMAGGTIVDIPASVTYTVYTYDVTTIGTQAFFNNGLTIVIMPSSITSIGNNAFSSNQLTSITIPNSVTSLGTSAFGSNLLNSVTLSNNLTTIESNTFRTNNLQSIDIPASVTSIGNAAFHTNQLTSVIIPNGVTNIGNSAFQANQITDITIPSSMINIEFAAFRENSIATVTSSAIIPPTIFMPGINDSFWNRSVIDLFIPVGTLGAYVTDAGAQWTGFNSVTEDPSLSNSDFVLDNDIKVITSSNQIKVIVSNNSRLQNYTLYSISGSKLTTGKESTIQTTALANGIYILKLDFDKGTVVKKVVVN